MTSWDESTHYVIHEVQSRDYDVFELIFIGLSFAMAFDYELSMQDSILKLYLKILYGGKHDI